MRLTLLVAALLVSLVTVVRADPERGRGSDEVRARNHFEAGRALYDTGNYEEAMREFALGFELVEKPEFVLNIGLCHYRLGHWAQARDNYLRFLQAVPADHPRRRYAEERLAEVERDLAADKHAPSGEPVPVKPPPPAPAVIAPPPPIVTPALIAQPARPPRKSWMRRNWWVIPVVTVAAAGIAVGLAVGLTRNDPCAGAGACVALQPQ